MLTSWIHWLLSMPRDELLYLVAPILLIDGLRYCATALCVWFYDLAERVVRTATRSAEPSTYDYAPSVSVVIAGLNEADSLEQTLELMWGTYPRLQFIIVDDGSTDGMSIIANRFAAKHRNVVVITKRRGGKSSALNAGLAMATNEIVVVVDADSELGKTAIWEIVQPLADPRVAAVGGNVIVRNANHNLLTRLQAFEYLRSILLGRIVMSRLGLLGIVSGAFGAFRRSTLEQLGGWDVGPGEDEDLILRIRKLGQRVEFAPAAECRTEAPVSWKVISKQRRRWEWAVVTFGSRKHIDMANPFNGHFRFSNFLVFTERWLYNLILPLWCWIYVVWYAWFGNLSHIGHAMMLFYVMYVAGDFLQYLLILDYTSQKRSVAKLVVCVPLMPFYQLFMRVITTIAILEEIFNRRSYKDGFVPPHVRKATWHW